MVQGGRLAGVGENVGDQQVGGVYHFLLKLETLHRSVESLEVEFHLRVERTIGSV